MIDFRRLISLLASAGVEFILVGGYAATIHGAARPTYDMDVVYRRTPENLQRTVDTLAPINPRLRGAPEGLPFRFDTETLRRGLNFTLTTDLGDIDMIGEIIGGGNYEDLVEHTESTTLFGNLCRVLNLDKLIDVKRAAARPKDFEAIAELEAIRDRLRGRG